MLPLAFWQGVEEFNRQQFYACHDTLEALWMEATGLDRDFYQGILQIAVACYHLGNNNLRGAVILLGEGIRRLNPYQLSYEGVDVAQLVDESNHLLKILQQTEPDKISELLECLQAPKDHGVNNPRLPKICELPPINLG